MFPRNSKSTSVVIRKVSAARGWMAMSPAAEANEPIKRIFIVDPNAQFSIMLRSVLGGLAKEREKGWGVVSGAFEASGKPLRCSAGGRHDLGRQT